MSDVDQVAHELGGQVVDIGGRSPCVQGVPELHRAAVIGLWIDATEAAISTLRGFRGCLAAWHDGAGPADPNALALAVSLLDAGGLSEWAEWGAGLDLDALQRALFPRK